MTVVVWQAWQHLPPHPPSPTLPLPPPPLPAACPLPTLPAAAHVARQKQQTLFAHSLASARHIARIHSPARIARSAVSRASSPYPYLLQTGVRAVASSAHCAPLISRTFSRLFAYTYGTLSHFSPHRVWFGTRAFSYRHLNARRGALFHHARRAGTHARAMRLRRFRQRVRACRRRAYNIIAYI